MKHALAPLAICLAPAAFAQQIPDRATLDSLLGANLTLEDFESYTLSTPSEFLGVNLLDHTTIVNNQGPGLVAPGADYSHPSVTGELQMNGDGFFGLVTQSLTAGDLSTAVGMVIVGFDPPVTAAGLDATGYDCCPYSGTAAFRDSNGQTVGVIPFTYSGLPNEREFVGWQHAAGIASIEVFSPAYLYSPVIDDIGFGSDVGTSYCGPANPNSTGSPAVISAIGSTLVADNDMTLSAAGMPQNQNGYFLNSMTQGLVQNPGGSQGNLCLDGQVGRYTSGVFNTGATGTGSLVLDLTATPTPSGTVAIVAGETWNFTCWFRDDNPGPTSNFSDGISILFE